MVDIGVSRVSFGFCKAGCLFGVDGYFQRDIGFHRCGIRFRPDSVFDQDDKIMRKMSSIGMEGARDLAKYVLVILLAITGCAAQKELIPVGGSRADGTVQLAFEYGLFEVPKVDPQQGVNTATRRCSAWGYTGAEVFGGIMTACIQPSRNGCVRWRATAEYQCIGTGDANRK